MVPVDCRSIIDQGYGALNIETTYSNLDLGTPSQQPDHTVFGELEQNMKSRLFSTDTNPAVRASGPDTDWK